MLGRLMPREGKFFDLFNAHAERIVEGSRELAAMIGTFTELDAHAQRIDAAERAADKITHETIALLHKTFITPIDRDQIHQLINTHGRHPRPDPGRRRDRSRSTTCAASRRRRSSLAEICQMCCERVQDAVGLLHATSSTPRRSSRPARRSTASSPTPTA